MADVAVLGTVAADVVLRVDAVPEPGAHISASSLGWRLGGGSANVAGALATLGHDVTLVGPVGGDAMGDLLLAELARRGVATGGTFRVKEPTPRALILLDAAGERTIVGVDDPFTTLVYPLGDLPELGRVDGVYVETWDRFPTLVAERAPSALLVTSPPRASVGHWPADVL